MLINICNICERESRKVVLCVCLVIRDLIRKWIALYKAWQRSEIIRFVCIFILNTCGILPIIYLIINRDKTNKKL